MVVAEHDLDEMEVPHWTHEPVALGSPAAGSALTYTVPPANEVLVVAVSFTFTASAQAANRIPFVQFLDQTGTAVAEVATPYKLIATNASRVTFGVGIVQFGADSAVRIGAGIPAIVLSDGMQLSLSATAIDAADTITAARMYVRQWRQEGT